VEDNLLGAFIETNRFLKEEEFYWPFVWKVYDGYELAQSQGAVITSGLGAV